MGNYILYYPTSLALPAGPEGQFEIAAFKGKEIRRVLQDNEWYYSVVDVVEAITDTASPSRYWNELKAKLVKDEGYDDLFDIIEKVKMPGVDGRSTTLKSCTATGDA